MDVLLQIIQPPCVSLHCVSTAPHDNPRAPDAVSPSSVPTASQERSPICSQEGTTTTIDVGCLRLLYLLPSGRTGSKNSADGSCWYVSVLRTKGAEEHQDTTPDATKGCNTVQSYSVGTERLPLAVINAAESKRTSSSSSAQLRTVYITLSTPSGKPVCLPSHIPRSNGSLHAVLSCKMHQLILSIETSVKQKEKVDGPLASTVFFCGSNVSTRNDALFLTVLHRILVECVHHLQKRRGTSETQIHVDVSLVTLYELWGIGDVLATEDRMFANQETVTWQPLSLSTLLGCYFNSNQLQKETGTTRTLPSALSLMEVSNLVQEQLRVWFARIDNAAAIWSHSHPSVAPLTTADKLACLESNVVICTLRFRASDAYFPPQSPSDVNLEMSDFTQEGKTAFLSLMLLPDRKLSCSTHRASAVLWREFEALSVFMQSFPRFSVKGTHHRYSARVTESFATTANATLHASALRRSQWLTALARLQSPGSSSCVGLQRFAEHVTPNSFSWVGCVSADWAHCRATRSTLAFLGRLNSHKVPSPRLSHHRNTRSDNSQPTQLVSPNANMAAVMTASTKTDKDIEQLHGRGLSVSTSSQPLSDEVEVPRPITEAPQPYQRFASNSHSSTGKRNVERASSRLLHEKATHTSSLSTTADLSTDATQLSTCQAESERPHGRMALRLTDVKENSLCEDSNMVANKTPLRESSTQVDTVKDLNALVASLRLYTSTLEAEVCRLRSRLARYEAVEKHVATRTSNAESFTGAPTAQQLSASHQAQNSFADPFSKGAGAGIVASLALRSAPTLVATETHGAATHSCALVGRRDKHVEQLESKVALYEQKLALIDYYVTPTLTRCADEIDHCLQPHLKGQSGSE